MLAVCKYSECVEYNERRDILQTGKIKKKHIPVPFILASIVPTIVLLVLFLIYPAIKAGILSFQHVGLLRTSGKFVGFENYAYLLKDDKFKMVVGNTLRAIIEVPVITLTISFFLAIVLHRSKLREKNLYVTFYFFPYFMSSTVVAIVWSFVFYPTSGGVLNGILSRIGLKSLVTAWLGNSRTALGCIEAVIIWCCIGYYIVLYLSALDGISPELYEAAKIDGATTWQQIRFITFPLMKNIIGITFVLLMSGTLAVTFVYTKVMTNGGPNGASTVLLHYIYQQGLENGNIGYASAITVFTMAMAILLAALSRIITSRSAKE